MAPRAASPRSVAAAATPTLTTPTALCWRQSLRRLALTVAAIRVAYLAVALLLARLLPDYDTSAELVSADCAADWPVKAAARARERAAAAAPSPASSSSPLLSLLPPSSPSSWGLVWTPSSTTASRRAATSTSSLPPFSGFSGGGGQARQRCVRVVGVGVERASRGAPPPASLGPRAFAAAGLVINNLAFVAAAVLLAHLGRAVLGGPAEQEGKEEGGGDDEDDDKSAPAPRVERASLAAALLYGLQPASIFTAIPYTESLFAMLTFAGLCCLYCPLRGRRAAATSSNSSKRGGGARKAPAAPPNRLAHALRFEAAALFFCLAACLRSNGAVNAGFLLHAGAAAALAELLPRVGPHKRRRQGGGGTLSAASAAASAIAAALFITLRAAACAAAVLVPSLLFQRHIAAIFCDGAPVQAMAGDGGGGGGAAATAAAAAVATRQPPPSWCGSSSGSLASSSSRLFQIRSSYAHVQARYWGVGPLAYWRARQMPNFALALPALALAAGGALGVYLRARPATLLLAGGVLPSAAWEARVVSWVEEWLGRRRGGAGSKGGAGNEGGRRWEVGAAAPCSSSSRSSSFFSSSRRAAVFTVQMLALALFAALTMNVQVATRMLCSSCPALYWSAAEMAGLGGGSKQEEEEEEAKGQRARSGSSAPRRRRSTAAAALWAYCAGFALAGAVMSLQALPWT